MRVTLIGAVSALLIAITGAPTAQAPHSVALGRLYFQRGAFIYVAAANGSGARPFTHTGTTKKPDLHPSISPDGSQLAYAQGGYNIYVVPMGGGKARKVVQEFFADHPAWSPDGSRLAYDALLNFADPYSDNQELRSVATSQAATGKFLHDYSNIDGARAWPTWAPDGHAIVAVEYEKYHVTVPYIALITLDTAGAKGYHVLGRDPAHDYLAPAFSPDGRHIACIRAVAGRKGDGTVLWVMNADTSGGHQLASAADQTRPAWSPDGMTIAFSNRGATYGVAALGGKPTLLVRDASSPAWGR